VGIGREIHVRDDGHDGISIEAVLTYHVVAGKVMAADVVKLKTAKTVQGQ